MSHTIYCPDSHDGDKHLELTVVPDENKMLIASEGAACTGKVFSDVDRRRNCVQLMSPSRRGSAIRRSGLEEKTTAFGLFAPTILE